jgi:hypothetical protein
MNIFAIHQLWVLYSAAWVDEEYDLISFRFLSSVYNQWGSRLEGNNDVIL